MKKRNFLHSIFSLALIFSINLVGFADVAFAQTTTVASAQADGLKAIEQKAEELRAKYGIPGMSLAIVKDGKVIYAKGLGLKDFENKVAVTADTQFAIGSATKAFTALSVLMTADEGKIKMEASPKTVLPYFKMYDADTDKNMTIRDLLTHSSGLNRTDIAMITGKLKRAELIRVAGEAKPIGKLREKFGYQNIMYAAAGEIVAVAQKQPWETFVADRIFKPLGMNNTNLSVADMAKAKDHSLGYNYNFDTKETKELPYRDIGEVGPAGAINSSANDMVKWIQFILDGGVVDGKRLVSESGFAEWVKPQMKVDAAGNVNYALGWFVDKWKGETVVQHGGNIDGFNSLVAMVPDKKLGFVLLTNVSASSIGDELMPIIFENLIGTPKPVEQPTVGGEVSPEKEAGTYRLEVASMDIDVKFADGKLTMTVPGQPTYTLEKVAGRKYKLDGAPDGFFMTFKDNEAFLEQPHGNFTLPKKAADTSVKPVSFVAAKELIGKWQSEKSGTVVDIKEADGKVTLNIDGQQPYALIEKTKDEYAMSPLPDSFSLKANRGTDGKITGFTSIQPQGNVEFKRFDSSGIAMTVDELHTKVLAAAGGEANWKMLTSRITTSTSDLEQQGVKATATTWAKAPNKAATETKMTALGKEIATGWEYFDGSEGEEAYSFSPTEKYSGKRLEDIKLGADFHAMLDWKTRYKSVTISRITKIGDEEAYVVVFEPEKGTKFTEYYSTKTFLMLRREGVVALSTSEVQIPYTIKYSDYRDVDGVKISFRQVYTSPSNGDVITVVTSVKHNTAIADSIFAPRMLK